MGRASRHSGRSSAALWTAVAIAALIAAPARAQPQPADGQSSAQPAAGEQPAGDQPAPDQPQQIELPPEVAAARSLGLRAEAVRQALAVAPVVVICPDEASYLRALRAWTPGVRFPVLIDDGSWEAAADIARFVRTFEPDRVLWYEAPDDTPDDGPDEVPDDTAAAEAGAADGTGKAAPARIEPDDFRGRAEAIVARAWGVRPLPGEDAEPAMAQALDAWATIGLRPFGVVACNPRQACRVAAVALAAGRGQPIAWIQTPTGVNGTMTPEEASALIVGITGALDAMSLEWGGIGDVDAITLCAEAPVRIEGGGQILATTDVLGRDRNDPRRRWAWAGQIFGKAPDAAYRAMCALFLRPESAWLFDGYPTEGAWMQYDQGAAAAVLRAAGLDVSLDDDPNGTLDSWRSRAGLGVDADVIFVTSKGMKAQFALAGGVGQPEDVPFLRQPAAVYFIHSFSAVQPRARGTVAGRWLARGAYAYFGSVDEPFLQSFVPPATAAARLAATLPIGAALRTDEGPPWKLTMIGDPLITLGPPASVAESDPVLAATPLAARMRASLRAEPPDFGAAVRTLAMLGRDDDAAQLAAATLRDRPEAFDAALADAAILPLLGAHDRQSLMRIAQMTSDERRADALDALWHAAWRHLHATSDSGLAALMAAHVRDAVLARDARDVAEALRRASGPAAARNFLSGLLGREMREADRQRIEELIGQLGR